MTACTLLSPLFILIPYLITLVLEMQLSNISVKTVSGDFSRIGEYRIEIGRVRCGLGFYCYSLAHAEARHSSVRL